MKLDMFSSKIETKDSLLPITKNCDTLEQTQTKPQETPEFKLTLAKKLSHIHLLSPLVLIPNG